MSLAKEKKSFWEVLNLSASCMKWKCCPCHHSCAFSTHTAQEWLRHSFCICHRLLERSQERWRFAESFRGADVVWLPSALSFYIKCYFFWKDRIAWLGYVYVFFSFHHFTFQMFHWPVLTSVIECENREQLKGCAFIRNKMQYMTKAYIMICSFYFMSEIIYFYVKCRLLQFYTSGIYSFRPSEVIILMRVCVTLWLVRLPEDIQQLHVDSFLFQDPSLSNSGPYENLTLYTQLAVYLIHPAKTNAV